MQASLPGFAVDYLTGAVDKGTELANKAITATTGLQFGDGGGTNIGTNFGPKILNKMTGSEGVTQTLLKTLGARKTGGTSGFTAEVPAAKSPQLDRKEFVSRLSNKEVGEVSVKVSPKKVQIGEEVREGGDPAWRNLNSGNLKYGSFAKKQGAIGKDNNGFAIFPTKEIGDAAQEKLLFDTDTYLNLDLTDAIARYAPKEDDNDVELYRKIVLKAVGGINKKMSDYSKEEQKKIISAIREHEGARVGKVTNA